MPDLAYVHNQRKDHLGQWVPLEAYETITVSADYPYTATLSERPANGIDIPNTTVPEIPGLQITTNSGAIGPSEYYVNYLAGIITFHSSKAGLTYTVHYYKTGTVVTADQINAVIARLVHFNRDPLPTDNTYEIGTMWVSTNTVVGVGTVRKIWLCSDIQGNEAKWSFQGPSISVENDLNESTSVNVYGDGRIEFVILDEIAGCFNCSRDFFVYNLGPTPGVVKNDAAGKLIGGQSISFADMGITVDEPLAIIDNHLLHRLTPGNKHIPAGGSYGQVLRWTSNGTAAWDTISADYTSQIPINIEDDIISHESSPGFMHIPAGGSSGQALIWASDGTAAWVTLPSGAVYAASAPITLTGNTFGHSVLPGYNHIPAGGSTDNFLSWSSNGIATWKSINIDGTFALNSDSEIPSQKAIKTYVDNTISTTSVWERVDIPSLSEYIRPKTETDGIMTRGKLCVSSSTFTGPISYGLQIIHDATGMIDSGVIFKSQGQTCFLVVGNRINFYGEMNIVGNLVTIRNVPYFWPTSNPGSSAFSVLANNGMGQLTWNSISTDGSMAPNSDFVISSQKAIKTYVDNSLVGLNYWTRVGYVISPSNPVDWLNNPYKLQASFMTVPGLVRNDSSGYLTGGNKIFTSDLDGLFVLPVAKGGTGLSTVAAGKILYGLNGTSYSSVSLSGVAHRISLDSTTVPGTLYIQTPQDIDTSSVVNFGCLTLNRLQDRTGGDRAFIEIDTTSVTTPPSLNGYTTILRTKGDIVSNMTVKSNFIKGIFFHKLLPYLNSLSMDPGGARGIELSDISTNAVAGAYTRYGYGIKIGNIGSDYLQGEAVGIEIGNITADTSGFYNSQPLIYGTPATVGLRIGAVSGGYNPLSIHTKGGNILHEGCNSFTITGYPNPTNIPDRGSAYINLDYTCVNDMSSVGGIVWKMNGIPKMDLRTQYVNYTAGYYDDRVHNAGNLHFYGRDDTGGYGPDSLPSVTIFRKSGGMLVNGVLNVNSFSTIGYYGNIHDSLEPPFSGYNDHPGSFQGGTTALWTIKSVAVSPAFSKTIMSGSGHYPPDHPRAFWPLFSLADHYGLGSCRIQHGATFGTDQTCGMWITLPFTIQPGWRYDLRARIKTTAGKFNCVMIGNSSNEWYTVWYDPNSNISSTESTTIWHFFHLLPLCASGNMLNCNRLWLGDKDTGVATDYEITWVEVKQMTPTDLNAVGAACYISQEMIVADKIQFGGLRLDPSQTVPGANDGIVGDIRIIKDNGSGQCKLYTKVLPTVWKSVLLSV